MGKATPAGIQRVFGTVWVLFGVRQVRVGCCPRVTAALCGFAVHTLRCGPCI